VWETLLLDVLHHQVVFTIPRMLRIFLKYKPKLFDHRSSGEKHFGCLYLLRNIPETMENKDLNRGCRTPLQALLYGR
jgi:hypothetical protein